MLATRDLEFAYNEFNQFRFPDITCGKGEHWLIMGRSGCGKTTLLHLMAGLLSPTKGNVQINETNITVLSPSHVDRIRGTEIGIIFQIPHYIQSLTVAENILIARYLNRLDEDMNQIEHLLTQLNIGHKAKSMPHQLSQGELQRMSIARALVNHPSAILADEPTSSLDDVNCEEAVSLLIRQAEESDITLVIVTHDKRLSPMFKNIVYL